VKSYINDIRVINNSQIEVDTCEVWTTSTYQQSDGQLVDSTDPTLLPQTITIQQQNGSWFITNVNFLDAPAFCNQKVRPDKPAVELLVYLIIPYMGKLIAIVGASGVGKTALVSALANKDGFETAYEQHTERPFQSLFKNDARYALANQIDYFLLRAEQEKNLRASPLIGLIDGGLDLDFYGFTRLFHKRGLLTDPELDLCRRLYEFIRQYLPRPELIIRLRADESTVAGRLSTRDRINIASAEDTALFNIFLDQWLASIPSDQILELDVSNETLGYEKSVKAILDVFSKCDSKRHSR
jgi:deoxyadenosine/deoxycytidine kinase